MEKVTVNASTSYEIFIDKGILDSAGGLISQVIKKGQGACCYGRQRRQILRRACYEVAVGRGY